MKTENRAYVRRASDDLRWAVVAAINGRPYTVVACTVRRVDARAIAAAIERGDIDEAVELKYRCEEGNR